ncbi:hypothetical protein DBR32_11505 [Taibaiella sp. KBW10]|uniref:sensor histidine kinase n=1 Tax=Taibaiella sp. KBW10 TaxID=2153357 RepID=UPI000F5B0990|nr:histidine kinase [Taibaiella sp. KBW10]RQO30200.1 hypothetical protein DBR32_11505 [Taibaiella sp. KBW10]
MAKQYRTILFHILGCAGFLLMPVLSSPDFNTGQNLFTIKPFLNIFSRQLLLLLFFYVNYYWFLPKLFFNEKKALYFLISALCFIVIFKAPDLFFSNGRSGRFGGMPPPNNPMRQSRRLPRMMILLFEGGIVQFLLLYFSSFLLKINNRLDIIRHEKVTAELSYLKAQINPHFLFNTLNSLYALTLEKSNEAPEAVLKLSGIMRYVVSESMNDYVSLKKEVDYIKDYIALQQLRLSDNVRLHFDIKGSLEDKRISPMVLIPFIENAFKYGVNPDVDSIISIQLQCGVQELQLRVENKIVNTNIKESDKTETGIENARKRLAFLYPNKHKLHIAMTDNELYIVDLKMFLA